jgi:hypothetical protein
MRRHQAVRVQAPPKPPRDALQQILKASVIELVTDDCASCDSARPHVVVPVPALDTACPWHGIDGSR